MVQWHRIRLKGTEQVMPDACPNCMGPSTHHFRYGYKGWKGWLTRTTYYQTFYYCEPCMKQADSALGLGGWSFFGGVLGFFAWLAVTISLAEAYRDPETHRVPDLIMALVFLLGTAVAVGIVMGIRFLVKAIKQRRHPLKEGQAVWGVAAYYTGSGFLDVQSLASYKAVRREWLAEMVRLNAQQVDDATYQAWVGEAKPAPEPEARPFGG